MVDLVDKLIGVYHFVTDRVPENVPLVEPKPRTVNPWCRNGQALISKTTAVGDIRTSVDSGLAVLGHLEQVIGRGDNVLVKPNFNSPDPFPGSTDLEFLRAVLELLLEAGARVVVGESAEGIWRPTRKVLQKVGVYELAHHLDIQLIVFEDRPDEWVRIKVSGDYLDAITMPRSAYEADRLVYLPCMKTHSGARFTGTLKLAVGFMHPGERRSLHASNLEQKVAEISLCWQPDLIIMDGRKAFVSGGPATGQLAEPGLLLASRDLVAIDIEAMKIISSYGAKNKLFPEPWQSPQFTTALKHGLGSGKDSYIVVE